MDTTIEKVNFKVKSTSNVPMCALSLSKLIEENKDVEITAIGASAVNQAVKIIARARAFVAQTGRDLMTKPGMRNVMLDGKEISITVFNFRVE